MFILPHRQKFLARLHCDRVVPNDIQPFIIVAIAARRVIHRTVGVDLIVDNHLLQMHEAVVLIDFNGNTGFPKSRHRGLLLRVVEPFTVGDDANIHTPLLGLDQRLDCKGGGQPVHRDKDVSCGTIIDLHNPPERLVLRGVPHLH